MSIQTPEVEKDFATFFRSHPHISPVEANRSLIEDHLAKNLKVTNADTIAQAAQELDAALAKQTPRETPQGRQPEPTLAAAPAPEPEVDLRKLSPDQLRTIVRQQDRHRLPDEYTRERISAMSQTERNILVQRYGSDKVRRRVFEGI